MQEAAPAPVQTVDNIRAIVGEARTKAQQPAVSAGRGGARAGAELLPSPRGLAAGRGAGRAERSCGLALAARPLAALQPLHAPAPPAPQPAARDFNEEDYMDGDLMDEELVE